MIEAYMKVVRTIQSAHYQHLKNGSVLNLINNFGNIYNNKGGHFSELLSLYQTRLKLYEQNN